MEYLRRSFVLSLLLYGWPGVYAQDGTIGVGFRGSGGSAGFTLGASQGSQRSAVSQSAMLTVPNGGSGFIASGTLRPFVTSFVPVVDSYAPPYMYMPPANGLGVPFVNVRDDRLTESELRSMRREAGIRRLANRARQAEEIGKIPVARMYYRMAIRRATGETKADLEKELARLSE